jgi:virginiamycin B lyase
VIGAVQKEGEEYVARELELGRGSAPSGVYIQNETLWMTRSEDGGKIALFNITTSEAGRVVNITEAAQFPKQQALFSPADVVINGDSAWITEHGTTFLTEYNMTNQKLTRYPTSLHPVLISTLPFWLVEDADRKGVWFNEHRGNRIAFFDFSTRTLTEYEVPTINQDMGNIANVLTIAADPNNKNRVWFTEWSEDKIGYVDKSVPIPFDIRTLDNEIVLEKNQTAQIEIEIIARNPDVELFNNSLSLNASSSAIISGVLLNASISFSPNSVDLSEMSGGTQAVTLELKNEGLPKGNHTLAVSATDGAVTRTVYVELTVR